MDLRLKESYPKKILKYESVAVGEAWPSRFMEDHVGERDT
jgi:hypothetical protein